MKYFREVLKIVLFCLLLFWIVGMNYSYAAISSVPDTVLSGNGKRVFVIHTPIRDLIEFRELARQAARLKPFGRVEVNISTLDDKGKYCILRERSLLNSKG
jgi:hypothetical protein